VRHATIGKISSALRDFGISIELPTAYLHSWKTTGYHRRRSARKSGGATIVQ
jgi:hypothetical protein